MDTPLRPLPALSPADRRAPLAWSFWRVALVIGLVIAVSATGTPGANAADGATKPAEPSDYRNDDYRSPVPATLKGARTVTTAEAEALFEAGDAVFIDVYPQPPKPPNLPKGTIWRAPKHISIKGATWLPNVGYGTLAPNFKFYLAGSLETLSGRDPAKPLVFFCLRECWMSWNTAKRAIEWGYTNVIWFPDGIDGWREFDNATEPVLPYAMVRPKRDAMGRVVR